MGLTELLVQVQTHLLRAPILGRRLRKRNRRPPLLHQLVSGCATIGTPGTKVGPLRPSSGILQILGQQFTDPGKRTAATAAHRDSSIATLGGLLVQQGTTPGIPV